MKKILLALGVLGVGCVGVALAMGNVFISDSEKYIIADHKKSDASTDLSLMDTDKKGCSENILINMDGINLLVPRYKTSRFILVGGESLGGNDHPKHNCDVSYIKNVEEISWGKITLQSAKKVSHGYTTYSRLKNQIDSSIRNRDFQIVSGGLKKISQISSEIYILPEEGSPTASTEPVALECTGLTDSSFSLTDFCNTSYYHPSGLRLSYTFFRKQYPVSEYIDVDHKNRNFIEKFIRGDMSGE